MPSIERAYKILGLPPGSARSAVHHAYRDLAQVWHPDRFVHNPRLQRKAQENLRRINEAYEVLRDYEPPRAPGSFYTRIGETFGSVFGFGGGREKADRRESHRHPSRGSGHGSAGRRRSTRTGKRSRRHSERERGVGSRGETSHASGAAGGHSHHSMRRAHGPAQPENPSGRPAPAPPPLVGLDAEELPADSRAGHSLVFWLVLVLSLGLVIASVLLL